MARSNILNATQDLQTDGGSVLWSIIQGEQLEFPITLNFITHTHGDGTGPGSYIYEAVIMEADNVQGSDDIPTIAKPSGVNTTLTVRVPPNEGNWLANTQYDREDTVQYPSDSGTWYKLKQNRDNTSAVTPNTDTAYYELYVPNKVYVQFPAQLTLSPAWGVTPTTISKVRGFFELRVTEPTGGVYTRTWKPVRGLVEFSYSPTQLVV